jgi:hypothetical protein
MSTLVSRWIHIAIFSILSLSAVSTNAQQLSAASGGLTANSLLLKDPKLKSVKGNRWNSDLSIVKQRLLHFLPFA